MVLPEPAAPATAAGLAGQGGDGPGGDGREGEAAEGDGWAGVEGCSEGDEALEASARMAERRAASTVLDGVLNGGGGGGGGGGPGDDSGLRLGLGCVSQLVGTTVLRLHGQLQQAGQRRAEPMTCPRRPRHVRDMSHRRRD